MILEPLTPGHITAMKALYIEAFPSAERKPFGYMLKKSRSGVFEMLSIIEDGDFAGLAITMHHNDMVLLDYFAISADMRGHGSGSEALGMLKVRYADKRFFLEIELQDEKAANSRQRESRKKFYLKNGMQETGLKVELFGVPMEILTDGKPLSYEEYFGLYKAVISPVLSRRVRRLG